LLAVLGTGLADQAIQAEGMPLPLVLAGTSVLIGGIRAFLLAVSPERIEAQIPFEVTEGDADVAVFSGDQLIGSSRVQVRASAPVLAEASPGRLLMQNQDYSQNGPPTPAAAGTTATTFCLGLGAVDPPVSSGVPAPAEPLPRAVRAVSAKVGPAAAVVTYAGLVPGLVGVCQVNVVIPPELTRGDYPMSITVGDQESNSGLISVAAAVALQSRDDRDSPADRSGQSPRMPP
jgi:uncharacterized protein (TIGR03437 family)